MGARGYGAAAFAAQPATSANRTIIGVMVFIDHLLMMNWATSSAGLRNVIQRPMAAVKSSPMIRGRPLRPRAGTTLAIRLWRFDNRTVFSCCNSMTSASARLTAV